MVLRDARLQTLRLRGGAEASILIGRSSCRGAPESDDLIIPEAAHRGQINTALKQPPRGFITASPSHRDDEIMIPRRLFSPAVRPLGPLGRQWATRPLQVRRTVRLGTPCGGGGGVVSRRWESTTTGEEKSGHIAASPNESILFFDSKFPPPCSKERERERFPEVSSTAQIYSPSNCSASSTGRGTRTATSRSLSSASRTRRSTSSTLLTWSSGPSPRMRPWR